MSESGVADGENQNWGQTGEFDFRKVLLTLQSIRTVIETLQLYTTLWCVYLNDWNTSITNISKCKNAKIFPTYSVAATGLCGKSGFRRSSIYIVAE